MIETAAIYRAREEISPVAGAALDDGEDKSERPDADWIAMDDVNSGIPTPTAPAEADALLDKLVQSHLARSVGPGTGAVPATETKRANPVEADPLPHEKSSPEEAGPMARPLDASAEGASAKVPTNLGGQLQQELAASTTAAELDALLSNTMDADEVVRASAFSSSLVPATLPLTDPSAASDPFVETKAEVAGMTKIEGVAPAEAVSAAVIQRGGGSEAEPAAKVTAPAETPMVAAAASLPAETGPQLETSAAPAPEAAAPADAGVTEAEGAQLVAATASDPGEAPSPQTQMAMCSRGFAHDLALMIAQLVDMPFMGVPPQAKRAGALMGALLAAGGIALLIVAHTAK